MQNVFLDAAFDKLIGRKLRLDWYCDLSSIIYKDKNKRFYESRLEKESSHFLYLYKNNYPKDFEESKKRLGVFLSTDPQYMSLIEADAILNWFLYPLTKDERKKFIRDFISRKFPNNSYKYAENGAIVFDKRTELYIINSVTKYIKLISEFKDYLNYGFYRGHSCVNYFAIPSINRVEKWKKFEDVMYQELLANTYDSFNMLKTPIDILIKMQHYGLPTRLLDITANPLVALYFACLNPENKYGEVIFLDMNSSKIEFNNNESISKLSCLSLLSYKDKQNILDNNIEKTQFQQIYKTNFGTETKVSCENLIKDSVLLPQKNNQRIIKQDGAFIVCGLSKNDDEFINRFNEYRFIKRNKDNKPKQIICICNNKSEIIRELDMLSINELNLFPEVDYVANYIKDKYYQ